MRSRSFHKDAAKGSLAIEELPIDEVWVAVPDPELSGYEASSLGRIRSINRVRLFYGRWGLTVRKHKGKLLSLKTKPNGSGQFYQCFYADGGKYLAVNRTICLAFHGPAPTKRHEAAHLNGDSMDTREGNLVWATPAQNAKHKIGHGTDSLGSKNARAVVSEGDIRLIFETYASGESAWLIADRYGIKPGAVSMIIRRITWAHVPIDEWLVAAAQRQAAANILAASRANRAARAGKAAIE